MYSCSSLKQNALLEQMIVEGALCSKVSCIALVEARSVPGKGRRGRPADETRLLAGQLERHWWHSERAAEKVPQSTSSAVLGSMDEPLAASPPCRLALRQIKCSQLCLILKDGKQPPLAWSAYCKYCQGSNGIVGA